MPENPRSSLFKMRKTLKTLFNQTTQPTTSKEPAGSANRTDFLKHAPIIDTADQFKVKKELQKGYTLNAMYNEILEYYQNNESEVPENTTPKDLTSKIIDNFKQELVNKLKTHGLKEGDAADFWQWKHTKKSLQAPQLLLLETPKGPQISHQGIIDKNIIQTFIQERKNKHH